MKFILENSDETLTTPSGLGLIGLLLSKTKIKQRFNQITLPKIKSAPNITHGDVVTSYVGLLCQGKNDYGHIEQFRAFHAGIGKILKNPHYLGDDYYPAIIEPDTFEAVQEERIRRASALGRIRELKEDKAAVYPTTFRIIEGTQVYDNPFEQAEYAYTLIESEVQTFGDK